MTSQEQNMRMSILKQISHLYLSFLVTNNVNKKRNYFAQIGKYKVNKYFKNSLIWGNNIAYSWKTEGVRFWQHIFQYTFSNIKSNHVHPFPCHLIPLLDIFCFPKYYNENQSSWQNSSLSELPYLSLVEPSFVKFYFFSPLLWLQRNSDIYGYKKCKGNNRLISS